ncbi:MAG: hypothetical protein ACI4VK_02520 [Candidatus Coproplasma sp.]
MIYIFRMALKGFLYLVLTFTFCFITVHFIKLAIVGFLSLKGKKQPPPKAEKKTEPVYYIVEKKRQRKATYSQPKEIEFKK